MGAPLGNTNGAKRNRLIGEALKRQLVQTPEDAEIIARKAIALAKEGVQWATEFVAERVDGKMPQAIVGDDDEPAVRFSRVVRQIVDPQKQAGSADPQPSDR